MRCDVEASHLASVLVLDKQLEPVPDPFRLQPDMLFVVSFDTYLRFIALTPERYNVLNSPIHTLHAVLDRFEKHHNRQDGLLLLKSFYIDMAYAVCKELHYAEERDVDATYIRHAFNGPCIPKRVVITEQTASALSYAVSQRGFPLPSSLRTGNVGHWNYACKLYQDASALPTRWQAPDLPPKK